jgi:hypothetical protein
LNWTLSIVLAVLTGVLGLFATGFLAAGYARWYHMSHFEGKADYFMIFAALVGGVMSLLLGLVVSRLVAAGVEPGFLKGLGCAWGTVLLIAGGLALIAWLLADIPPKIDGNKLELQVEIKLPASATNPPASLTGDSSITLGSVVNSVQRRSQTGEWKLNEARLEAGRWIVPGTLPVFTMRGRRNLSAVLGGKRVAGFLVPLPARPGRAYVQWSDWLPHPRAGAPAWPDTESSYRFRVQPILPPPPEPPGPSAQEAAAAQAAREQAVFDAIPPTAPIKDLLPYTRYGTPATRLQTAITNITSRDNFVAELSALIFSKDDTEASDALRMIEHIPQPPKALVPVVAEFGRNLAALIAQVNTTKPEQDPRYLGFVPVSIRFSAWTVALPPLREKAGGDFTPELRAILELSRIREDSHLMQEDVRRVASYYMQQWAGVAPVPGDPKPS